MHIHQNDGSEGWLQVARGLENTLQRGANLTDELRQAAKASRVAKLAHWSTLTLRQDWIDKAFMLRHLSEAQVKVGSVIEPATTSRVRTLLKRAGVDGSETKESLGCSLDVFLEKNTLLPLWAAVALVLESTGRFTVFKTNGENDET